MLKNILKGIGIGVANVIPGVSGGTLAVVLGVYDKLTEAIGNFFIVSINKKIEYGKFLLQIALGAVIGILLFAKIIEFSYSNYPTITTIIFILLILPSIPFILKNQSFSKKNFYSLIGGVFFTLCFMFVTYKFGVESTPGEITRSFSYLYGSKLFFCGVIAAGAMIIPGISGSLLLLILGEYYNILGFISNFHILPLIFFSLGTGLGLIGFSKVINILLKKFPSYTLYFIVGIILVSLGDMISRLF